MWKRYYSGQLGIFLKVTAFILLSAGILLIIGRIYTAWYIPRLPLQEEVKKILKEIINNISKTTILKVNNEAVFSPGLLPEYYKKNDYLPAWVGKAGLLPMADTLIAILKASNYEGLNPADYHLTSIETLLNDSLKYKTIQNLQCMGSSRDALN